MKNDSFTILITGDFVIDQVYDKSKLSKGIIELFQESDLNIVNLEAPVTNNNSKILKTGPHLKSEKQSTYEALKALNIHIATLANNHILDYDEGGVKDTLEFCKENNIQTVGAGMDLKEASRTLYIETPEGKIAIVNFAENEWASAAENRAGANPMDIIDNFKQIQKAKKSADFVFVIVHGGHEYYNLPSPRMQKQYRFYAESGADIVIAHHPHCISGFEEYKGVPIYYSLGNFIFTKDNIYEDWYNGLILEVEIINGKISTKLYLVEQEKRSFKLSLLEDNIAFGRLDEFNEIIIHPQDLDYNWDKYIDSQNNLYLKLWSPFSFIKNRYLRYIINCLKIKLVNEKGLSLFLNLMRCEAHRDTSKEVIKKYLKNR